MTTQLKSMYIVGEIDEPVAFERVYGRIIDILTTLLGIGIFGLAVLVYLFSAGLMTIPGLRSQFADWGFVSLVVAILLFLISAYFRNRGFMRIINGYQYLTVQHFLGKRTRIFKPEVYAVSIRFESAVGGLITLLPYAYLSTYNRTYKIPIYKFKEMHLLYNYFLQIGDIIQDEFYSVVQTSEVSQVSLLRRIWKSRTGRIGLLIVIVYLFFALWGGVSIILFPPSTFYKTGFFLKNPELSYSFLPEYTSRSIIYLQPNALFLFGTDFFGRDVFARLVFGTFHSIAVALIASSIYVTLSMVFGYISGLSRGVPRTIISRGGDLLLSFPPIIPLIIVATFVSGLTLRDQVHYYYYVFGFMAMLTWPQGMRLLQTQVKALLEEEYLAAARQLGGSPLYLFRTHLFPKTLPTVVYLFVFSATDTIIAMTMLGLIGLGLGSTLTWGSDIERAITFADITPLEHWWTFIFPSIWISLIIIGLLLLSDSLRDITQAGGTK
ncbi:MAG: ABC transporter permease [Candidatus Kariarchaeaceae archaeon]|jgi:peptide/nickel transport system permease protein